MADSRLSYTNSNTSTEPNSAMQIYDDRLCDRAPGRTVFAIEYAWPCQSFPGHRVSIVSWEFGSC